jgi:hypothetical protein
MKIYKHEGKGFWIGSCVIVITENEESAKNLIKGELVKIGLNDEEPNPSEINIIDGIIYSYNGDY